jgi:hypothetical protein
MTPDAHPKCIVDYVHTTADHAAVIVEIRAHLVAIARRDQGAYRKKALSRQKPRLEYEFMRSEPIQPVLWIARLVCESFHFAFRAHNFLPPNDFG